MKVLILTITAGQGHNSTSLALADYLLTQGVAYTILDTYKYLSKIIGDTLDKGYLAIGKYTPKTNAKMYVQAEKASSRKKAKSYFPYTFRGDVQKEDA